MVDLKGWGGGRGMKEGRVLGRGVMYFKVLLRFNSIAFG